MISAEQLNEIATNIETCGVGDATVSKLRQQYQSLHFTFCMDDDLPNNEPVIEKPAFNLYLIDGRDHCMCLTKDYEAATGVVVAEIIPE
jgi:Family of unknown function (DUF6129)